MHIFLRLLEWLSLGVKNCFSLISLQVKPRKLRTVLVRMSDYVVAKQHRVNNAVLNKVYLRALYDPTTLSSQVWRET